MPFYKVQYKTDADDDHRYWLLGELRDARAALLKFNSIARVQLGKEFEIYEGPPRDATSPSDYCLEEQDQLNTGRPVLFEILERKWPAG